MPCPDKGTNEVEGMLASISSVAEVMVFSAVNSAHALINGEAGKILQDLWTGSAE